MRLRHASISAPALETTGAAPPLSAVTAASLSWEMQWYPLPIDMMATWGVTA